MILLLVLAACSAPTRSFIDNPTLLLDTAGDGSGDGGDSAATDSGDDSGDSTAGDSADSDTADSDTADSDPKDSDTGDPVIVHDPPAEPIVVYAVRHAEKESEGDDPGLTEEGQARALALVDILHDVPLAAIYATELLRTQETVAPTAEDHGLIVVTDIDPEQDLADYIYANHAGDIVLHAGHSYTLTDFFEALGIEDAPSVSDYGDLWIVTIETTGVVTYETSHYGEE